jgi:ribosomal protein L44E
MFEEIFGKFNGGPNPGNNNGIGNFAKTLEEKDAEIRRLKEMVLRCPKCGTKLRYPRG